MENSPTNEEKFELSVSDVLCGCTWTVPQEMQSISVTFIIKLEGEMIFALS